MAKNYFKRYIWLIDVISRHGHITRSEINDLWSRSPINESGESRIPERTFHNHIDSIFDIFGLEIKCDRSLGYYLANSEDIESDGLRRWMLSSLSLNNLLNESTGVRDCIIFEDVPSSEKYLTAIMEAIRDRKVIEIKYRGFNKKFWTRFEAEPYCLKQFKQRWYMVAKTAASATPWIYGLDRIVSLEKTDRSYSIPKKFKAEAYFRNFYGVCIGMEPVDIEIKVHNSQAEYFRSLQLHGSQKEFPGDADHVVFRYHIAPTFDFKQEIISKMDDVEVLSPESFRKEIKDTVDRMAKLYAE
jgi:hypothetical protein